MTARVLVVGLDAGAPEVVRALSAAGRMPTFASLVERGASIPMTEVRGGCYVAERWTSMVTGVGPEVHGYYSWCMHDPAQGVDVPAPLDPAGVPRLWDVASDAGRRVAVLDVPRQPVARVNGIQLCEWGSHDRDLGTCSWPPDLVSDIESQEGEHPLAAVARDHHGQFAPCDVAFRADDMPRTSAERRALAAVVRESAEVKARVSERLLASDQWDLFFTVFAESHCATHQFWDLHEPDDLADPSLATEVGDVVADTFARIDRSLGQLVRLAGAGATVVLVLHTGMAADSGGNAILPEVVARLAGPSLPFVTCAFSNAVGAIRVRVEGRDRGGTVAPLAVPGVVARLSDDLMALVDDNTGTPAVRAIHTSAEAFPAIRDDTFPDLLVEWNGQDAIRSVSSRAVGTVTVVNAAPRTGNHTPDGLVVVAGPGIEAGSREPMDPASFSPMVAAMLDVR